jgi:hypothetical protein
MIEQTQATQCMSALDGDRFLEETHAHWTGEFVFDVRLVVHCGMMVDYLL